MIIVLFPIHCSTKQHHYHHLLLLGILRMNFGQSISLYSPNYLLCYVASFFWLLSFVHKGNRITVFNQLKVRQIQYSMGLSYFFFFFFFFSLIIHNDTHIIIFLLMLLLLLLLCQHHVFCWLLCRFYLWLVWEIQRYQAMASLSGQCSQG